MVWKMAHRNRWFTVLKTGLWLSIQLGIFIFPTDLNSIIFQRGGEKPPTRYVGVRKKSWFKQQPWGKPCDWNNKLMVFFMIILVRVESPGPGAHIKMTPVNLVAWKFGDATSVGTSTRQRKPEKKGATSPSSPAADHPFSLGARSSHSQMAFFDRVDVGLIPYFLQLNEWILIPFNTQKWVLILKKWVLILNEIPRTSIQPPKSHLKSRDESSYFPYGIPTDILCVSRNPPLIPTWNLKLTESWFSPHFLWLLAVWFSTPSHGTFIA